MPYLHHLDSKKLKLIFIIFSFWLLALLLQGCDSGDMPASNPTTTTPSISILLTETSTITETLVPTPSPTHVSPTNTATIAPSDTPEPTSSPTSTPLPKTISDKHGIEMILIPAGSFTMGSDNNQATAKPAHSVFLDAYYIDKFEVTNEMYLECLEDGACTSGGSSRLYNSIWDNHPVMDVTWYEAQNYCQWRGGRLPTEAEWEKAARGTDERLFPWGNEPVTCERARYGDCGWFTVPVGQHPDGVSPYGVHDMAGNAWEWTLDWYKQDYYSYSPLENPQGPSEDTGWKSTRGGAWFYMAGLMTAVWRNHAPPSAAYSYLGFRCIIVP